MSVIFGLYIWWKTNKNLMYYFVNDSNKILAIITSICLFLYFKNLKIKSSKFINSIAASTFGVLCIHANSDTMRTYLWKKTLNNVGVFKNNEYNIFLHSIMSVLVVFSICVVIDQIRIKFVEKKFFEFYDKK